MLDRLTSLFDEQGLEGPLLRLIDGSQSGILFAFVAVLTAAGIGAIHAVGPGHGKALIGAYLAGSRGRPRDAVALGGLVAAMHSASVLALGLALHLGRGVPGGQRLEPVLMLVSAAAVTAVGVGLIVRQVRGRRRAVVAQEVTMTAPARHLHPPNGGARNHHHGMDGDHTHGSGNGHHHALPDGVPPLSRAGVVALATSGGLLPSPAAFLVLATAMALGRTAFGLALVGAFSVGLAMTLTAVGLAILWGRDSLGGWAGRHPWLARLSRAVPLIAAVIVVVGGGLLATAALLRL